MRIHVKEAGGHHIRFAFPTRLALNFLTAAIVAPVMSRKLDMAIPASTAVELFRTINRYRRQHPDWVLVDAESPNGDKMYIKL